MLANKIIRLYLKIRRFGRSALVYFLRKFSVLIRYVFRGLRLSNIYDPSRYQATSLTTKSSFYRKRTHDLVGLEWSEVKEVLVSELGKDWPSLCVIEECPHYRCAEYQIHKGRLDDGRLIDLYVYSEKRDLRVSLGKMASPFLLHGSDVYKQWVNSIQNRFRTKSERTYRIEFSESCKEISKKLSLKRKIEASPVLDKFGKDRILAHLMCEGQTLANLIDEWNQQQRSEFVSDFTRFVFFQLFKAGFLQSELNSTAITLSKSGSIYLQPRGIVFKISPVWLKATAALFNLYLSKVNSEQKWKAAFVDAGFLLHRESASYVGKYWVEECLRHLGGFYRTPTEASEGYKAVVPMLRSVSSEVAAEAILVLSALKNYGELIRLCRVPVALESLAIEVLKEIGMSDAGASLNDDIPAVKNNVIWVDFQSQTKGHSKVYGLNSQDEQIHNYEIRVKKQLKGR